MWSFLLLWSCMRIAVVVVAQTAIYGHRGERLDIRCAYKSGYESNSKYFCKGECNFGNKIIMVKSGSPDKDERFSLTDDTTDRVFTVSITDLKTEDAGLYWCAVERMFNTDVYSEILLLVKQAPLTPQTLLAETSPPDSGSFNISLITGGLVLLLICAVLLIVAVQKKKTCGLVTSSNEELHVTTRKGEENTYETGNSDVVSNSHIAQSDDGSASNKFHRPATTEAVDADLEYINVAAAVRNSVNPDQIYTQLNASRQSHIYQSLTADSVQEESIYHNIDQTMD